jgi:hypothetical protein
LLYPGERVFLGREARAVPAAPLLVVTSLARGYVNAA